MARRKLKRPSRSVRAGKLFKAAALAVNRGAALALNDNCALALRDAAMAEGYAFAAMELTMRHGAKRLNSRLVDRTYNAVSDQVQALIAACAKPSRPRSMPDWDWGRQGQDPVEVVHFPKRMRGY